MSTSDEVKEDLLIELLINGGGMIDILGYVAADELRVVPVMSYVRPSGLSRCSDWLWVRLLGGQSLSSGIGKGLYSPRLPDHSWNPRSFNPVATGANFPGHEAHQLVLRLKCVDLYIHSAHLPSYYIA
jgi:hypothetical protein